MSKPKKLHLQPHNINDFQWWYEEEKGIAVVAEARRPDGTHITTETVFIRWSALLAAARRAGKAGAPNRTPRKVGHSKTPLQS